MLATRRFASAFWLIMGFALAFLIATQIAPWNPFPLAAGLFVIIFGFWFVLQGGGSANVPKDCVVIRSDLLGHTDSFERGSYVYIPGFHSIEAVMPNYPLRFEFPINAIDTRTAGLQRIDQIKVRVHYRIINHRTYYGRLDHMLERIKDLEESAKLKRSDSRLWKQVLGEVMKGIIDDAVRDGVWRWAEQVARDPDLRLDVPFDSVPTPEFDPYALSLNRTKLADKIADEVGFLSDDWGLEVDKLVFETIEIDPEMIKRKTRNRDRELADAEHDAQKEAIAIRVKGMAEAEVRAQTVARVIEVLLTQKGLSLTEQTLYNIVRAAMYSDGEMIWQGVIDRGQSTPVKTA